MLLWIVILGFVSAISTFLLAKVAKTYHETDSLISSSVSCSIVSTIILVFWLSAYAIRWDDQRKVEAFVASEIYEEFIHLSQGINKTHTNELVDLSPISRNFECVYNDIKWCNKIIITHTEANKNPFWDWNYPDWDAPEIIKLGD